MRSNRVFLIGFTFPLFLALPSGLDKIYELTNTPTQYELRFDLGLGSERVYAVYDNFKIAPVRQKFKLTIGKYRGTAGGPFASRMVFKVPAIQNVWHWKDNMTLHFLFAQIKGVSKERWGWQWDRQGWESRGFKPLVAHPSFCGVPRKQIHTNSRRDICFRNFIQWITDSSYIGKAVSEEGRVLVGFEVRQVRTHSKWDAVSTHTAVCCITLYLAFY